MARTLTLTLAVALALALAVALALASALALTLTPTPTLTLAGRVGEHRGADGQRRRPPRPCARHLLAAAGVRTPGPSRRPLVITPRLVDMPHTPRLGPKPSW